MDVKAVGTGFSSVRGMAAGSVKAVKAKLPGDSFTSAGTGDAGLIDPSKVRSSDIEDVLLTDSIQSRFDVKWKFKLDPPEKLGNVSPVARDDGIFLNYGGVTRKISNDGQEEWKVETGASGHTRPVFDKKGNLYVTGEKTLFRISSDGKVAWEKPLDKRGSSHEPLLAPDGKLYVVDNSHRLHCFNTRGKELWSDHDKGLTSKKPFMDNNGVLHLNGSAPGMFKSRHFTVDTARKSTSLSTARDSDVLHPVVSDADGNFYGFEEDRLLVTGPDGQKKWTAVLPGETTSTKVQFGPDDKVYVSVRNESLLCYSKDGKEQWRIEKDQQKEPISTDLAWDKSGNIYFTGDGANWKLYSFTPDGKFRWDSTAEENLSSARVAPDGAVYTGGDFKSTRAFNAKSGRLMTRYPHQLGFGEVPAFTTDDGVLVADTDGNLEKLEHVTTGKVIAKKLENSDPQQPSPKEDLSVEKKDGYIIVGGVKIQVNED